MGPVSKCKSGLGWRWSPLLGQSCRGGWGPGYHLPAKPEDKLGSTGQAAVAGLLVGGGGQGSVSTAAVT